MSDTKTIIVPDGASDNGMLGLLAPLIQRGGLDPNMVFAMMNRSNGFGGEGGWFIWVIFLFFLMGWGNGGWGNGWGNNGANGLPNLINNDAGRESLMSAIQGNGQAISQLASTLNCSVGQIQQSLNAVMTQIQSVGNQVGLSAQQTINAIQSGDACLAKQLSECCCENRLAICQQTNTLQNAINSVATGQERGFASIGFETQRQTCDITKAIADSTAQVLAGQRAAEMRELQRDLAERDRKIAEQAVVINNGQQTAIFGQMIQQATAPLMAGQAAFQKELADIKCKLPETTTIPYSPVVGVPTCVAAQYGLAGYGVAGYPANGFFY